MATAVAPPLTPKVTTSVDPLYADALAQAKQALAAQTAPLNAQIQGNDATAQAQEAGAIANAKALGELLATIAPRISAAYSGAAQDQGVLAKGFSTDMQNAVDASGNNVNDMLAKINAPAGQMVDPAKAAGAADVLYGLGGYIPGKTFSEEGAAYTARAAQLPAEAALRGVENSRQIANAAAATDAGLQNKIAEMAGNLPGDVATNYRALQTMALNDAKFRETLHKDSIDAAYKQAEMKLAQAKYSTGVKEFNAKQSLAQAKYSTSVSEFNAKQQLSYAKLANTEFNQNRDYAVKLANLKISSARLQQTILKNSFAAANGGLSKQQVSKFVSIAQSIAMKSFYGYTKVTSSGGTPKATPAVGATTFAEALQNILGRGVPVQIALDALDRVYPVNQRPTPAILAQVLGPLDPAALAQVAAGRMTTPGMNAPVVDSAATQPFKNYAFSQFKKYGWSAQDAQALDQMWQRESGWDPTAHNPSGALGIPQALGHTLPADYATNPQTQIDWGLNYVKNAYGTPTRAWAFWQATASKNANMAPADLRAKARQWIAKSYVGY